MKIESSQTCKLVISFKSGHQSVSFQNKDAYRILDWQTIYINNGIARMEKLQTG